MKAVQILLERNTSTDWNKVDLKNTTWKLSTTKFEILFKWTISQSILKMTFTKYSELKI